MLLIVALSLTFTTALASELNSSSEASFVKRSSGPAYIPQVLQPIEKESEIRAAGVTVRLLQLHGRAAVPPNLPTACDKATGSEKLLHEFDELTIEWKSPEPVASVLIRLPEREQCSKNICTGYTFWTYKHHECKIKKSDVQGLPSDTSKNSIDEGAAGGVSRCDARNSEPVDGPPKPHRSTMVALLKTDVGGDNGTDTWHHFTVHIRNPPETPTGNDINLLSANSFQVVLNNTKNEALAVLSFKARDIKPAWVCGYTEWVTSTPCTAECGGGKRISYRRQLHSPPQGLDPQSEICCDEDLFKEESCNVEPCDVSCVLSEWTTWNNGECSRSCGGGVMVQRRTVLMDAKGNGLGCPHFSEEGFRVRTRPCNPEPCPARCVESPLVKEEGPQKVNGATPQSMEETASDQEGEVFLAIGADSKLVERPRTEVGKAKGVCSEPCGGGKRKVVLPSEKKDFGSVGNCDSTYEEDCNMFSCHPLMFLPAYPWSYPVRGEWFLMDLVFVVEELTESMAIRAPPDYFLAASGDENECFLVEHSLPVLGGCTILPGQVENKTGPVMMLNFTNPLEPQRPANKKRNYFHLRFWVQHPKDCTGGTSEGECKGLKGDRDWTLLTSSQQPNDLWELVKGSYAFYVDKGFAEKAAQARQAHDHPITQEAEPVMKPTPEAEKNGAAPGGVEMLDEFRKKD